MGQGYFDKAVGEGRNYKRIGLRDKTYKPLRYISVGKWIPQPHFHFHFFSNIWLLLCFKNPISIYPFQHPLWLPVYGCVINCSPTWIHFLLHFFFFFFLSRSFPATMTLIVLFVMLSISVWTKKKKQKKKTAGWLSNGFRTFTSFVSFILLFYLFFLIFLLFFLSFFLSFFLL